MDAPIHFAEHGLTVDRIPAARLVGPAVIVDVRVLMAAHIFALENLAALDELPARAPPSTRCR